MRIVFSDSGNPSQPYRSSYIGVPAQHQSNPVVAETAMVFSIKAAGQCNLPMSGTAKLVLSGINRVLGHAQ